MASVQHANAELQRRLDEALAREAATGEVLNVINSSPGELAPVFETILEKAHILCGAAHGTLTINDGGRFRAVATHGIPEAFVALLRQPFTPAPGGGIDRLLRGERLVHVSDLTAGDTRQSGDPIRQAAVRAGVKTLLFVPLRKDGALLGHITAHREEVRPFSDQEITLLESFAAQAVIAIENARLITETREALEQQTATAEVLGVINSSPGDLTPVFEAMLERALRLCDAASGHLYTYDGARFHPAVMRGDPHFAKWWYQHGPVQAVLGAGFLGHMLQGERVISTADVTETEGYRTASAFKELVDKSGLRSGIGVALRSETELLGAITIYRQEVRPFTDKQTALMQNFAAQAVIAMENARLVSETREALEQQTATAEVLGIINASPGELKPVFDAMLDRALVLCSASFGQMVTYDGAVFRAAAWHGYPPRSGGKGTSPTPGMALYRLVQGEHVVQIADITADEVYRSGNPVRRRLADAYGARTAIWVALRKEAALAGAFVIYRTEVRPFTEKQIALLQSFAQQAVIAMENARLITETREALEQQTATAEVLQVINSSPGDLAPVFDVILVKAHTLCGAALGSFVLNDGERLRAVATRGYPKEHDAIAREGRPVEIPFHARLARGEVVHVPDLASLAARDAMTRSAIEGAGSHTYLAVPLRKDGALLGYLSAHRREVRPFTDKQIALLENFAAQAVIAMENARLITETREALDQQTATAEVLGVINSSPGDLQPVFDAMLEKATRLCEAAFGVLWTYDDGCFHTVASHQVPERFAEFLSANPFRPPVDTPKSVPRTALHRIEGGEDLVRIDDVSTAPGYRSGDPRSQALVELGRARSYVAVALRKDGRLLGVIAAYRQEVRPFTDTQIALLQNFAAQAVIAMENARLLGDLRERTEDLQQSLEYQTATSDVLNFISRSAFDLTPVLEYVIETAIRLCRAHMGSVFRLDDGVYRWAAGRGLDPTYREIEMRTPIAPGAGTLVGRVALEGRTVQIADAEADPLYGVKDEARITRARTMLGVPLLRDGAPIGVIAMARDRVELFNDKEIALVTTFADQAVIAIENVRLITETREARYDAEAALRDLTAAQANLIQAEKMASLGQLTAGIAHEIKNPLNFVNNFASLSVELLDELKETTAPALATLDEDKRADVDDTMELLTGNLEKIAEHGRRADNIVKSMLEHSRGVSGERREVDLNTLVDEALNLAYHGARAQDQSFNITLARDYAERLKPIEVAPQEMTRVFLNLIGNGFYAATKRAREGGDSSYRPSLTVMTSDAGEAIEVRVRDNGTGISAEIRGKLFQPFFTTKPTGEGTGLGLSISYDIVTQQHGGTITVESEPGDYTEFTIRLPRQ